MQDNRACNIPTDAESASSPLLEVIDLKTAFYTEAGVAWAVNGVSFRVGKGETYALVGESGCGKSVTALSILNLVPKPQGQIVSGRIVFNGQDLLGLSEAQWRQLRGGRISMIFQEPMTSLNPVYTVGNQITEAVRLHQGLKRGSARDRAAELLDLVGLSDARRRLGQYPHELSGGMRQRVMIAMALSSEPDLMIADEPTTALDVTIQDQILRLICDLQVRLGMAVILITHNLGVVAEAAGRVGVMYTGRLVETASVAELLTEPRHPYTRGLMASLPGRSGSEGGRGGRLDRLQTIKGIVPSLVNLSPGCSFQERCPEAFDRCRAEEPDLYLISDGHMARCFLYAK